MKLTALATAALLLSAGYAFAGAGAGPGTSNPTPPQPPGGTSSGRPTAVLNDKECEDAWNKAVAGPAGKPGGPELLTPDKGAKIMTDFPQADTDHDGTIDKAEFQAACKSGLVQRSTEQPSKP